MEKETKTPQPVDQFIAEGIEYIGAYKLIPEWQGIVDNLNDSKKGRKILKDSEFQNHLWNNSLQIECISEAVRSGALTPENTSPADARTIYYSHPSLMSMKDRVDVLKLISEVGEREISVLRNREHETFLLRSRRLASIYEELSTITDSQESEKFAERAIDLNLEVGESGLFLPMSPRKLHAKFSIYDIYLRRKGAGISESDFRETQSQYYYELADAVSMTRKTNLKAESISGSFGELMVSARLHDIAGEQNRLNELEISQSFIRHDTTNNSNPKLQWKWAFDLQIVNRNTSRLTPIEVKKRTVGSRMTSEIGKYLPEINVVMFRLGRSKAEYLEIAEKYCLGMHRLYSGESPSEDQLKAMADFHGKVDKELSDILIAA